MTPTRLLPWLFAAVVGPLCLFLALTVPTGEVPDEGAHALRAESLWSGELLGRRGVIVDAQGRTLLAAGVIAHAALLHAALTFPPEPLDQKRLTREALARLAALDWSDPPEFVSAPNTAVYLPVVYVPASIGLAAARAAGAGPHAALIAARALNAAAFVALGAAALAIARAGRMVMFVALTLPMTAWLAGSVNPDALLIATAALAAASLTRRTQGRRWPPALAGACLAVLGATKPSYLPMALAILARPGRPDAIAGRSWREVAAVAAIAAPGALWAVVAAMFVAVPFVRPEYAPGPLWPGDPGRVFRSTDVAAQLAVLARGPWRLITLPVRSMWLQGRMQAARMVGVLGLLDVVLPLPLYGAWVGAAASAVAADLLGDAPDRSSISAPGALAIAAGALASIWALWILQYLSWTNVGLDMVDGVQGRYFIPLLPFAGIALSAARPRAPQWARASAVCAPILVAAVSAMLIGLLAMRIYYPQ